MTKSQTNDKVGDSLAPPLKPSATGLACSLEQPHQMVADAALPSSAPSVIGGVACALNDPRARLAGRSSCEQILWFSFFFDGTGNNQDADLGSLKHSNVAKLYRAHEENDLKLGTYKFYIPGVGTYFAAVKDPGGTKTGAVSGAMGQERIDWAIEQFDARIRPHIDRAKSQSNTIREINVSIFGFSRGAALARAFSNDFLKKRCEQKSEKLWVLNIGKFPIYIRFMGLFDTVASVGAPMSGNNGSIVGSALSNTVYTIKHRLDNEAPTRPQWLAFAENAAPGSDPSPGKFDGHLGYGGNLVVSEMVEEVRHFVAAHELRNSFPLDSLSAENGGKISKPAHFFETVYPGVHSDVGGSYRPGEGGRSPSPQEKLGLIPLMHMYTYAQAKHVPFLPMCALEPEVQEDFKTEFRLVKSYNFYVKKVGAASSVGDLFNRHMFWYYSWRFDSIKKKQKGNSYEAKKIKDAAQSFKKEEDVLNTEVAALEKADNAAKAVWESARAARLRYIKMNRGDPNMEKALPNFDAEIAKAEKARGQTQDEFLRARARLGALPKMGGYQCMVDLYDQQLVKDAEAIFAIYGAPTMFSTIPQKELRQKLKPHYLALMDAYENEYLGKKRQLDAEVAGFFDRYVHDSLAGFALDATLPSDPRVIYLGGDIKYKYAAAENRDVLTVA